jgi:hypothetical protein
MWWEPLAEWGLLDSDFGDLSHPPTYMDIIVNVNTNISQNENRYFSSKMKISLNYLLGHL